MKSTIFTSRRAFVGFITTLVLIVVHLFDLPITDEQVTQVSTFVTVLGLGIIAGYSIEDAFLALAAGKSIFELYEEIEETGDELFDEDEAQG